MKKVKKILKKLFLNYCHYKIIACIISFLFIVAFFVIIPTFSENNTSIIWDGSISNNFYDGNGTSDDPYIINDGSDFAYFLTVINGEEYIDYFDKYYEIYNNINFNNLELPIGNSIRKFKGNLNGNGYSLSNILIDSFYLDENNNRYYSLFNSLDCATIKYINFDEFKIEINEDNMDPNELEENNSNSYMNYASIFGFNSNNTNINNISINNSTINSNVPNVESSFIFITDEAENNVSNINLNGTSNISNFKQLIYNYNDANINNVIYNNDYVLTGDSDNTVINGLYKYSVVDNEAIIDSELSLEQLLNSLNIDNTFEWIFENGVFKFKNLGMYQNDNNENNILYASLLEETGEIFTEHASEISNDTVYVNDLIADYNYYHGKNYSDSSDGSLPTAEYKDIYNDNNLVRVNVKYNGTDVNNNARTGYVSINERQSNYYYYNYYYVVDGYIEIDLIDNPFTDRPVNMGFNGWITDYQGAVITYDSNYYQRKAKIPVSFTNDIPNDIVITFHASWIDATVYQITSTSNSWSNAFNSLKEQGMELVYGRIPIYENMSNYFVVGGTVNWYGRYPSGSYNENGNLNSNNTRCYDWTGCTYYVHSDSEYNEEIEYYYVYNGNMTSYTPQIISYSTFDVVPAGAKAAGFYRQIVVNRNESITGYYNELGEYQNGTCTSNTCTYYELVQYYDQSENEELISSNSEYYYLVTRDTNIIVMRANTTSTWTSEQSSTKPFTLTSIFNSNDYTNYYLDVSSLSIRCYNDVTIENIYIYTTQGSVTSGTPSNANNENKYIYGNWQNLKIGRGLKRNSNYVNFISFIGGSNRASGSSSNTTKYKLIVESGYYSYGATISGSNGTSYTSYTEGKAIYGSDYDRISNNNDNLTITECLANAWGGNNYSASNTTIMTNTIYKSGKYGSRKGSNVSGIYFGQRQGGYSYALRVGKIEGGWYYIINGGPCVGDTMKTLNSAHLYITGGEITMLYGGAGRDTSNGNRLINMTGGKVMYSVFGGSNAYSSTSNAGTIYGSSYVYIGGNAVIGDESLVNTNTQLHNTDAGNVYGHGNGGTNSTVVGSNDNSTVIITDNAVINRNVYGGSNNGLAGSTNSSSTTSVTMKVYGGTINGSLYGGGNNNGVGNDSVEANIIIDINGGIIKGSVYGGSRVKGTIAGNTNINVTKADILNNVYGGGEGGQNDINSGTFVKGNILINIGNLNDNNSNINISNNVYGGSAYGSVNTSTITNNVSSKTTTVNINSGYINGSVFGGGQGNSTCTPGVAGNITVNFKGGITNNIYGANDANGTPNGTITVNLIGGTATNAYGGGNSASAKQTTVELTGTNINNIYGGSNLNGIVNETNVILTSGNLDNIYGGGNKASSEKTNVTINSGSVTTVYGGGEEAPVTISSTITVNNGVIGELYGGSNESGKTEITNIDTTGGTITSLYGGGRLAQIGTSNVKLNGGTIITTYGGGKQADVTSSTNIEIKSGTISTVYGGSNISGNIPGTYITVTSGNASTIYGGGKLALTETSNIYLNGGSIEVVYGGGEEANISTSTNINLAGGTANTIYGGSNVSGIVERANIITTSGTASNLYGGGRLATVKTTDIKLNGGTINIIYGGGHDSDVSIKSNIEINNGTFDTIYGGSNASGDVLESSIIANGGLVSTIYGGNNIGGATTTTNVIQNGSNVLSIYGGGELANTTHSNVTINSCSGMLKDVYGGGKSTSVADSHVDIGACTIFNAFGGSNIVGTVDNSNINIENNPNHQSITNVNIDYSIQYENNYDETSEYSNIATVSVTIHNNTDETITNYRGGIYIPNTVFMENYSQTKIITYDDLYMFSDKNNWYGNNPIGANSTLTFEFKVLTNSTENEAITYLAGKNSNGDIVETNENLRVIKLFGGNNEGGSTGQVNIEINSGIINFLYGGGNNAIVTGNTTVTLHDGEITDLYGGGNNASINGNTNTYLYGGLITNNSYGGGNEGTVQHDSNVILNNVTIKGSAYAGGNGSTATVFGNTNISTYGNTIIGDNNCTVLSKCSLFGGGNAAYTGDAGTNNSNAIVNISGAKIKGNVYGGANTSRVYGYSKVEIGDIVTIPEEYTRGNIEINGSIFGGGESNASGSTDYDFKYISVTKGISVKIDAANYNTFKIDGSIFGSGNASSTDGTSNIEINNYGNLANPKKNISIQRTQLLILNNCGIVLSGATDSTNIYKTTLFSLSRIDEMNLVNNTSIFLENNANLLQSIKSLVSKNSDTLERVTIGTNSFSRNVNNRIYMKEGEVLNISTAENVSATNSYGTVHGMTFFGMYKYNNDRTVNPGIYGDYGYKEQLSWAGVINNSSYVVGLHYPNHDITQDGFYTNNIDEDTALNIIDYIDPTPKDTQFYRWNIGGEVTNINIELEASRYSTLGAKEIAFLDYTAPNTSFEIIDFDYADLASGVSLIPKNDVPRVAETSEDADNKMSLSIESGTKGWLTNGQTEFVSTGGNKIIGTTNYVGDNTSGEPSLLFYIHHSKNLSSEGQMGTVKIVISVVTKITDLKNEIQVVVLNIKLSRKLITREDYEASITAGRKYELFASTITNITSKSSISAYYSLYSERNVYNTGYHRALITNNVLPLNTKITMIDLSESTPNYYYHVINDNDVSNANSQLALEGDIRYNLSLFEIMGSHDSGLYYDDVAMNQVYYHSEENYSSEEFIFILDFEDTNINGNMMNNQLLIEMLNQNDDTIIGVIGIENAAMTYNLYSVNDAIIQLQGNLSDTKIYGGKSSMLNLTTEYTQEITSGVTVVDTLYDDYKLGLKLSLLNSSGNVVSGTSFIGFYYEINGIKYSPNIDGITRISLSDRVGNTQSWIKIATGNSNIATGDYTLKVEAFGSSDGIYYGLSAATVNEYDIHIVNEIYGLDINTTPNEKIIDAKTGTNLNMTNMIKYNILYNSGLTRPNIHIKLYRKDYTEIYSTIYNLVDLADYSTNNLFTTPYDKEYLVVRNPNEETEFYLSLKNNLLNGTYKIQFILYDDTTEIGVIDKYIIIK